MDKFVNRKFCYQALDKKMELHKLDSKRLGFNPVKTLYFSKNWTPLNQLLAWKCRELKRTSMIYSTWSAQGVIRIRRSANERALSIKNDNDLKSLYLVNDKHKWIFLFCVSKLFLCKLILGQFYNH